jgi:O-antigen/teichoic acid export membrane protein
MGMANADMAGLRAATGRAVVWTIVDKWAARVLGFAVFIALARLLTPVEFGTVALAGAAVSLFALFIDQGIGTVLVTRRSLAKVHTDTAFWMALASSALLGGLCAALAPLFASVVGEPQVGPVLQVLSVGFLLSALQTTPASLLLRAMDFRTPAIRRLVATATGAVVGISAAAAGAGVWALVAQSLVGNLVGAIVLWVSVDWRPGLRVSRQAFGELWGFGRQVVGLNLLTFLNEQGDNLLIGSLLGPGPLGLYNVGTRLLRLVLDLFTSVISSVSLPAFSRMQHDREALRRAFLAATRLSAFLTTPVLLTLAATASLVIPFAFGPKWEQTVPVMQVLSLAGLVQCMTYFDRALLLACDRPGLELRITLAATAGNVAAVICGIPFGVVGVAIGLALRNVLFWPVRIWALHLVAAIPVREYLRQWTSPLPAALLVSFPLYAWAHHREQAGGGEIGLVLLAGGLAYLGLSWLLARAVVRELVALSREVLSRSAATPSPDRSPEAEARHG